MVDDKDQDKERGVVMDTPERTQIATPLSKFEDSPVFNYINNLSPIKPVKSMHFTQTFNSLSFASLPSVFTSPHVSSLKDSRFLRRHQFAEPSKPELSAEDGKKADISEGVLNNAQNPFRQPTNFDSNNPVTKTCVVPPKGCSNLESRKLNYEAVSPNTMNRLKVNGPSTSVVPYMNNDSANDTLRIETDIEGIDTLNHNKEVTACDWESLISDASELLNFDSPSDTVPYKDPNQSNLDHITYPMSLTNEKPEATENNPSEENEGLNGTDENRATLASTSINNLEVSEPTDDTENEVGSNLYRGMRRRCLVFEMGSRRKHLESGGSTNVPNSNETVIPNDNRLVTTRTANDSSRCILPGIGLHLNALSSTTVDHKFVKHENAGSSRQLTIASPYRSMASGQDSLATLSDAHAPLLEKDMGPPQNGVSVADDASKQLGFVVNEELSQTSPRKKRRRAEHAGETDSCKRCNCKKSKCLKLYCECFAAGVYCVEPCTCHDCFNKPIHEETVLATRKQIESRNPLAFAPKVIKTTDSMQEDESSTPASARHKRGCNCKKSGCLKKYCECYQGGVGCSINCRCEGCKNTFGRKDGSELDVEANLVDNCEATGTDGSLLQMTIYNEAELVSATPATPSRFGRQSIALASSLKGKPPRSFVAIGSSSSSSKRFGKLNPFKSGGKIDNKQLETVGEDEIPEILEENNNGSPLKSCSPNSKRVSPPHSNNIGIGQRSSRKLILQSIPSFPCLTPKH